MEHSTILLTLKVLTFSFAKTEQCDDFLAIHFILLHEQSSSDKEDVLMFCRKHYMCQTE